MDPIIKCKNLKKRYGKRTIFKNVNLEIKKGELFGVIGMSGSGKTTLLHTITGFLTPDSGDVLFYSYEDEIYKSVYKNLGEVKRNFGFSTQVPSFYPKLTLLENLYYFGRLQKLSETTIKGNAEKLLELIDLTEHKNKLEHQISEGMTKRLDIACSLMHNPHVLLMDEPTADLDPVLRRETWKLIKGILKMGTTVVVASHILSELESACDRIAMLHNKKIVAAGSPEQLKKSYSHKKQEIHLQTVPGKYSALAKKLSSRKSLKLDSMRIASGTLIIRTNNAEETLRYLLSSIKKSSEKLINVDIKKPSLEEVFEALYKKEEENAKHT